MLHRPLGRTGLKISEIGYGAWGIGGTWWGGTDDIQALAALKKALDCGINFIDTALVYGEGHSERLVGRALRETRLPAIVATKVPPKNREWPARNGNILDCFPATWVVQNADKSLKHLGVETIDLLQLHVWHGDWAKQDDWREAKERLVRAGKIRFFGISINDHEPDSGVEVVKSGGMDSVQVIFNLFDQTPTDRLLPACAEHGVGVIARCPLDEGGLSGRFTLETTFPAGDFRRSYFKGTRLTETIERAEQLGFLVREEIRSLAQGALKFVLSHPAVSTTIPGMRRPDHVEENACVSDGRLLSAEELERLKEHAWPRNFYSG
ncbi:MAG: aldo/keto reductase [Nitrospirae bacterium]|nr:aldo/keto reductase [Nitrospirota bacterium]